MSLPGGDLLKHVLSGSVGGERWTVSIWLRLIGLGSTPTAAQVNTLAGNIATGFQAGPWGNIKAWNSTDTTFDSCKTYLYRGGFLVEQGAGTVVPSPGSSATAHPGYVAVVTTLLTAGSGRSRRGRLYWPATGIGMTGSTSQITNSAQMQTTVDALGAWLAAFSLGIPSWPGSPGAAPVVVSQKLGITSDITSLRSDSLPDTQHGRTRRLVPVFAVTHTL